MTSTEFRQLRLSLGLSQRDIAEVLGMTQGTVSTWETKEDRTPPPVAVQAIRLIDAYGLETMKEEVLDAKPPAPEMTERLATDLAGQKVKLYPWKTSDTAQGGRVGVGRDGTVYKFRPVGYEIVFGERRGGRWVCEEKSIENGQVALRIEGTDTARHHARVVADLWLERPSEAHEAHCEDEWPAPENIEWKLPPEYARKGENNRPLIYITREVEYELRGQHGQMVRQHGLTYTADCVLRDTLGIGRLPTPRERKTGREPNTKRAHILLLARRKPHLTAKEIAERVGDTTDDYVVNVLQKDHVSLKDLRRRRERDKAIQQTKQKTRNRSIVTDAESGHYTERELAERYDLSRQQIRHILNQHDVSLAEAKRRKEEETREKSQNRSSNSG
jgi:transcriptional regulator with XRE-family HTH domain